MVLRVAAAGAHAYAPESILFVIDTDFEASLEAVQGTTRLELLKQTLTMAIQAKARANPAHRFAIATLKECAQLHPPGSGASSSPFLPPAEAIHALAGLQGSDASFEAAHLGSALELLAGYAGAEEARGAKLRVVVFYCRSCVIPTFQPPAPPAGQSAAGPGGRAPGGKAGSGTSGAHGVPVDALYIHERPVLGVNCPQEAYGVLEEALDAHAKRHGHEAYIFEAGPGNVKKVVSLMVWLMSHPAQRVPQVSLKLSPPDISSIPHQPLPSDPPALPGPGAGQQGAAAAGGGAWAQGPPTQGLPTPAVRTSAMGGSGTGTSPSTSAASPGGLASSPGALGGVTVTNPLQQYSYSGHQQHPMGGAHASAGSYQQQQAGGQGGPGAGGAPDAMFQGLNLMDQPISIITSADVQQYNASQQYAQQQQAAAGAYAPLPQSLPAQGPEQQQQQYSAAQPQPQGPGQQGQYAYGQGHAYVFHPPPARSGSGSASGTAAHAAATSGAHTQQQAGQQGATQPAAQAGGPSPPLPVSYPPSQL